MFCLLDIYPQKEFQFLSTSSLAVLPVCRPTSSGLPVINFRIWMAAFHLDKSNEWKMQRRITPYKCCLYSLNHVGHSHNNDIQLHLTMVSVTYSIVWRMCKLRLNISLLYGYKLRCGHNVIFIFLCRSIGFLTTANNLYSTNLETLLKMSGFNLLKFQLAQIVWGRNALVTSKIIRNAISKETESGQCSVWWAYSVHRLSITGKEWGMDSKLLPQEYYSPTSTISLSLLIWSLSTQS